MGVFLFALILVGIGAFLYFTVPGFKEKVSTAWAAMYALFIAAFAAIVEWWSSIMAMVG